MTALQQCLSEIRFISCENNMIHHYVQFRFIVLQHWKCMLGFVQTCSDEVDNFFMFMFMLFVETVNYLTLYNSFLYNYVDTVCTFCTFFLVWGVHRICYTLFGVKHVTEFFLFWHPSWIQNVTVKEAVFIFNDFVLLVW